MTIETQTDKESSLESFLKRPEIDEQPYLEFIDGRIEAKASPQKMHGQITKHLCEVLDRFAETSRLGLSFPELLCTFGERSIVPDVVFLRSEHIEFNEEGEFVERNVFTAGSSY